MSPNNHKWAKKLIMAFGQSRMSLRGGTPPPDSAELDFRSAVSHSARSEADTRSDPGRRTPVGPPGDLPDRRPAHGLIRSSPLLCRPPAQPKSLPVSGGPNTADRVGDQNAGTFHVAQQPQMVRRVDHEVLARRAAPWAAERSPRMRPNPTPVGSPPVAPAPDHQPARDNQPLTSGPQAKSRRPPAPDLRSSATSLRPPALVPGRDPPPSGLRLRPRPRPDAPALDWGRPSRHPVSRSL